jgi:hypothetical protein
MTTELSITEFTTAEGRVYTLAPADDETCRGCAFDTPEKDCGGEEISECGPDCGFIWIEKVDYPPAPYRGSTRAEARNKVKK